MSLDASYADFEEHRQQLLKIHRKNLAHIETEIGKYGGVSIPLILIHQQEEEINKIKELENQSIIGNQPLSTDKLYANSHYFIDKFVGRIDEINSINQWINNKQQSICVLEAIGGSGKSSIAWKIVESYQSSSEFKRIIWWSFEDQSNKIYDFILYSLAHIKQISPDIIKYKNYDDLLQLFFDDINKNKYLFVMDGLEKILYEYNLIENKNTVTNKRDCVESNDELILKRIKNNSNSKFLITTRLTPSAIDDRNLFKIKFNGLNANDARLMFDNNSIKINNQENFNNFLIKINFNPLIIKQVISIISNYIPSINNFDRWYKDKEINSLLKEEFINICNKILSYSLEGLTNNQKKLLYDISVFNEPINYIELEMFNSYLPPEPDLPILPGLPKLYSNPFDSKKLALLRINQRFENNDTIKNQIEYLENNESQLRKKIIIYSEFKRIFDTIIQERIRLLDIHNKKRTSSNEYYNAQSKFDIDIKSLLDKNLLQNLGSDSDGNTLFDLHPVMRSFVFSYLDDSIKQDLLNKIIDHIGSSNAIQSKKINLSKKCKFFDTYILTNQYEYAAIYFDNNLNSILRLQNSQYRTVINLLTKLFKNNNINNELLLNNSYIKFNTIFNLASCLIPTHQYDDFIFLINQLDEYSIDSHQKLCDVVYLKLFYFLQRNMYDNFIYLYNLFLNKFNEVDSLWIDYKFFEYSIYINEIKDDFITDLYNRIKSSKSANNLLPRFYLQKIKLLLYKNTLEDINDYFDKLEQAMINYSQRWMYRDAYYIKSLYYYIIDDYSNSLDFIKKAKNIAEECGTPTNLYNSQLALILSKHNPSDNSIFEYIQNALDQPIHYEIDIPQIYLNCAECFLNLGKINESIENAYQALIYSYINNSDQKHIYVYNKARRILTIFNKPLHKNEFHQLNSIDKQLIDRLLYISNNLNTNNSNNNQSQDNQSFEFGRITWIQIGTVAVFGVDDLELIESLARKITTLSFDPSHFIMTKMGEEIPLPTEDLFDNSNLYQSLYEEIYFTEKEIRYFDKFFLIVYLQGSNDKENNVFAYINVRFDRIKPLLDQCFSGNFFDLGEYTTLITTGEVFPSAEERKKLENDYLFNPHVMNVRIFPPLDQVT